MRGAAHLHRPREPTKLPRQPGYRTAAGPSLAVLRRSAISTVFGRVIAGGRSLKKPGLPGPKIGFRARLFPRLRIGSRTP
jgi:hypothetical protein